MAGLTVIVLRMCFATYRHIDAYRPVTSIGTTRNESQKSVAAHSFGSGYGHGHSAVSLIAARFHRVRSLFRSICHLPLSIDDTPFVLIAVRTVPCGGLLVPTCVRGCVAQSSLIFKPGT